MFKKLFGKSKTSQTTSKSSPRSQAHSAQDYGIPKMFQSNPVPSITDPTSKLPLRMPEVDDPPTMNLDGVFNLAREKASNPHLAHQKNADPAGEFVVVSPGRVVFPIPYPPPHRVFNANAMERVKNLVSEKPTRNITVIANNDFNYVNQGLYGVVDIIPFYGYLIAISHMGHNVIVFEGHPSAFPFAFRNTHMLIVDEAMMPFLHTDWYGQAISHMVHQKVVIFHRDGGMSDYVPIPPLLQRK